MKGLKVNRLTTYGDVVIQFLLESKTLQCKNFEIVSKVFKNHDELQQQLIRHFEKHLQADIELISPRFAVGITHKLKSIKFPSILCGTTRQNGIVYLWVFDFHKCDCCFMERGEDGAAFIVNYGKPTMYEITLSQERMFSFVGVEDTMQIVALPMKGEKEVFRHERTSQNYNNVLNIRSLIDHGVI